MIGSRGKNDNSGGPVISIIGPGMRVVGDCVAEGSIRVEGEIQGKVHAGKAVVIGKEGKVHGDVNTQDAVVAGEVRGTVTAASRLEIQATATVDGSIRTARLQLDDGAVVNGDVEMGEVSLKAPSATPHETLSIPEPVPATEEAAAS